MQNLPGFGLLHDMERCFLERRRRAGQMAQLANACCSDMLLVAVIKILTKALWEGKGLFRLLAHSS